jgi:plastocyanin
VDLWWASAIAAGASITGTFTDAAKTPVNDVVIYATPVIGTGPKPVRGANVEQLNKEFVPHVTPVQTGTLVSFPNRDDIRHHVYSFSPAKTFELKLYAGTSVAPQVFFDKPGAVVLGCNIHDHMLAYVYVVDTPHFAKSAAGGARMDNLQAGEYEVRVWHPRLRGAIAPQRVKLAADGAVALAFPLDLQPRAQPAPRRHSTASKHASSYSS